MKEPRVSVVVNTYDRAQSLRVTLAAFEQLDYENFEVVVVNGPSMDGTQAVLDEFAGRIKAGSCPDRNLSMSRNVGIALSAGDIIAFIDDDAYADPAWLDRLVEGYDSEEVSAAGGPVYDHTGVSLQSRYTVVDRFGQGRFDIERNPTLYLNSPNSIAFTHLIGTNSSFRRDRLVAIGGFDEEFEYFLDESDVCARLVDRGWLVRALEDGFVYHKFLPSDVRAPSRAARDRYTVLKNTSYFALKHGMRLTSFADVCRHLAAFVDHQRKDYRWSVGEGLLTHADLEKFEADIPRAFDRGFQDYVSGAGRTPGADAFASPPPFLRFPVRRPAGRRLHVVFLSQEWPPMQLNGIARVIHTLARGMAAAGHVVRVLTRGRGHDRVDLEDGVWVHRVAVGEHVAPPDLSVPQRIWDYSASLLDELHRIHAHRRVDVVQVPNWDSEGIAVILDGGFVTSLGLYTPVATVREIDGSPGASSDELDSLEALERMCYQRANALLACGPSVVKEIAARYDVTLSDDRVGLVAHGLPESSCAQADAHDGLEILFVGRLEPRKGVDTLLACIPPLVDRFPELRFTIVGNEGPRLVNRRGYREEFEASAPWQSLRDRVTFTGPVDDAELDRRYASCDIFVAPSRFESFGLILIEAMRVGKPVVASRIGGMSEIVEDGGNGFLVPAGDVDALTEALAELVQSEELRARMGARSRQLYEERFTVERMVAGVADFYQSVVAAADRCGEREVIDAGRPASAAPA